MRFSYIDSQGKEIEVDSVESLALRIELGAIEPETRMYDAVADRWAPAGEHPVFRSLSRGEEVTEEDIVPIPPEGEEKEAEPAAEEASRPADPDEDETSGDEDDPLDLDFQVSMAEEDVAADEDSPDRVEDGVEDGPEEAFPDFDLGEVEIEEEEEVEAEALPEPEDAGSPISDWDREDEGRSAEPDPEPESGDADGSDELPAWARDAPSWDDDEEDVVESPGPATSDAEPEPRHDAVLEAVPEPGAEPDTDRGREEGGRRATPARPEHWDERIKARERKSGLKKIAGALLALGVAGAVVWFTGVAGFGPNAGGSDGPEAEASSPIPILPTELRSVLDEAGDAAWNEAVAAGVADNRPADIAGEPPAAWLEGRYLSNAGEYPAVERYWSAIAEFAEAARSAAERAFPETLGADLARMAAEEESLVAGEVDRLVGVARRELALSSARRDSTVRTVSDVARAALALHRLLVEHQDQIAYEPYSAPGVSRDPVLEAVPETEELQGRMNARLDRVLEAIEESRMSRPITTSSVVEVIVDELRRAGWRYLGPPPSGSSGD